MEQFEELIEMQEGHDGMDHEEKSNANHQAITEVVDVEDVSKYNNILDFRRISHLLLKSTPGLHSGLQSVSLRERVTYTFPECYNVFRICANNNAKQENNTEKPIQPLPLIITFYELSNLGKKIRLKTVLNLEISPNCYVF